MTRSTIINTYHEDGSVTRTEIPWTPHDYAAWRAQLSVFRRAFRRELQARQVSEMPILAALYPNAPHLLAAADSYIASLDQYHPMRVMWTDVIEFLRSHPDVATLTAPPPEGFGATDEWLDDLFEAAIARGNG